MELAARAIAKAVESAFLIPTCFMMIFPLSNCLAIVVHNYAGAPLAGSEASLPKIRINMIY
jgi:hypothetical protein